MRLSRHEQNVQNINGKKIQYLWVKENLIVPQQKSHRIILHILCDMGLPCSKLNNLIKDRKNNICSFQKVHKHSLKQNELINTFTLKKCQTILVS